jgi:cysteinyl-tRNA synthetase
MTNRLAARQVRTDLSRAPVPTRGPERGSERGPEHGPERGSPAAGQRRPSAPDLARGPFGSRPDWKARGARGAERPPDTIRAPSRRTMAIVFHNTFTKRKEPFETLEPGVVRMYNCGPTVYGRQHVGNFRAFLFADLLRRWLEYRGYEVRQVMNITDVGHLVSDGDEGEDKVQVQARKEGKDPFEISAHYAQLFLTDLAALDAAHALAYPRATQYVGEMLEIVDALVERGHAYRVGGDVYFDVSTFPRYGQLSGNRIEDLDAGARIEVREEKRHPADFALWKSDPKHLMKWKSHYGDHGFPGWHIECSAMARALLGDQLDIHTGGEDNVFPHHECEIAQSESFTGKRFARFWLHCKFLQVDGGKMSKSLGNVYTLDDVAARGFEMRHLRYALLRGHYRQPLNFTWAIMKEAQNVLASLDELRARLEHRVARPGELDPEAGRAELLQRRAEFEAALDDDLSVPEALAALFGLREAALNDRLGAAVSRDALAFLTAAHGVLGFLERPGSGNDDAEIDALVKQRDAARRAKDWAESDRLRKELEARGIVLQDSKDGAIWRRG